MQTIYSRKLNFCYQIVTGLVLFSLLISALPVSVFAQEATTTPATTEVVGCTDTTAVNFDADATLDDGTCEFQSVAEETATSTGDGNDPNATSTDESTGTDGVSGENADPGAHGTTTATTTDNGSGADGQEGGDGEPGESSTPEETVQPSEPLPIISEQLIGDKDGEEEAEITGGIDRSGSNATITTGPATARGDVLTDANSTNVKSTIQSGTNDFDVYTFNATGSNEANVETNGVVLSSTGENEVTARNSATIHTGQAISAFNIANVINSNVVNSDGYIYLANKILEANTSLDLSGFLFPDEDEVFGLASDCDLLSCVAEDVVYNISQTNTATITNNAVIEANTGENLTEPPLSLSGVFGEIETGNAYAGANVINVVNTNIVDSNYRLLTFNAMGDLDGDLVLPTEEVFHAFFGRPNGISLLEEVEDGALNVDSLNDAVVDNNVVSEAETGLNTLTTATQGLTKTGRAESESNILNKINENTFGGDSMYLLVRIHGDWSGDVVGLPDGLTWDWTPDGIIIYNVGAEIAPSVLLGYDKDSYTANISNHNALYLENNLDVSAATGKNSVKALAGAITTGDAFASANVMNIANTNIIGTNWTFAVINIMGDFDGNVAFSQTDIAVTGTYDAPNDPLTPGDVVSFAFTVRNDGSITANNVVLNQVLQNAHAVSTATEQSVAVGDLAPGQSVVVNLTATVDEDLGYGTSLVRSLVDVKSDEADVETNNNAIMFELPAYRANSGDSGTTTDGGTGTTTDPDGGTATTTDPELESDTTTDTPTVTPPKKSSDGGGSSKTTTKAVKRTEAQVDPNAPPFIVVKKVANVDEDDVVEAGEEVDYTITVTNKGGQAYNAVVYDSLTNEIGAVIKKDSWNLGTILAGEIIELEYTTAYDFKTPSGKYTNTASIVAYRTAEDKNNGLQPLKISDAVYTIEIKGVPLAVGNVGVLAVLPAADGTVSALVAWETSKAAHSQVFYGPKTASFQSNETWFNYGFPDKSFKFSTPKTSHAMIIKGLKPGQEYAYRIDADNGEYEYVSRELTFTVPMTVNALAINVGSSFMTAQQILSRVAGAATSVPVPTPKPYVPPTTAAPALTPAPEPVNETPEANDSQENTGLIGKVKNTLFGLFR